MPDEREFMLDRAFGFENRAFEFFDVYGREDLSGGKKELEKYFIEERERNYKKVLVLNVLVIIFIVSFNLIKTFTKANSLFVDLLMFLTVMLYTLVYISHTKKVLAYDVEIRRIRSLCRGEGEWEVYITGLFERMKYIKKRALQIISESRENLTFKEERDGNHV